MKITYLIILFFESLLAICYWSQEMEQFKIKNKL